MQKRNKLPICLAIFFLLFWGAYKKADRLHDQQLSYQAMTLLEESRKKVETTKDNGVALYELCRSAALSVVSSNEVKYLLTNFHKTDDSRTAVMAKKDRYTNLLIILTYYLPKK